MPAGPGAGLGLFGTVAASAPRPGSPWWSWLWPWRGAGEPRQPTTLASFPLAAAITVRTACEDPVLGPQFSWMLDKQLLDERTAVMVYLLLERLRGDGSRFAPWIRNLPTSFDVPVTFSEQELAALRGTTLHGATAAVTRRMRETWSRLEAPLAAVARELGVRAPAWDDWVWAYCVYWSRGQSLPVPESGSASSALVEHSSNGGNKVPIQILEGLVPGLDFCNHRLQPPPQCWWDVVSPEHSKRNGAEGPASTSASAAPAGLTPSFTGSAVRLQLHAGARLRPGDELFISYGDKSNEELLMLYGFALEHNPHDHLMMFCPLPPKAEWDDVMHARMELLHAYGLRPQFFLPHPDQVASSQPEPAAAKGRAAAAATRKGNEVLDTLEVFVLNFQELAVRSKVLQAKMEERRAARASGLPLAAASQHSPVLQLSGLRGRLEKMGVAELRHFLNAMGLRMATLTTFIRLLELKVLDLEGAEGTGTLEEDERLLRAMNSAGAGAAEGPAAAAPSERRLRAALVYRIGQKQLARAWLVRAKGELANLLALMRDMQSRQDALERASQ
ncbi:hypothetical protein GPECTOR_1g221 [Gonium pectorale]|uniref:SET domain-containing protein n=1 Tax=Gonium pectorale TaxID=33097 RepID=A0A150H2J8_GONPE|nr:hypothetical protein GPECTOR_1g221 [Gonium pectorale]|eukprot:KXZ56254.1 hypothetical protein GPECTOR_1g221 [Gonium pectorale]